MSVCWTHLAGKKNLDSTLERSSCAETAVVVMFNRLNPSSSWFVDTVLYANDSVLEFLCPRSMDDALQMSHRVKSKGQ